MPRGGGESRRRGRATRGGNERRERRATADARTLASETKFRRRRGGLAGAAATTGAAKVLFCHTCSVSRVASSWHTILRRPHAPGPHAALHGPLAHLCLLPACTRAVAPKWFHVQARRDRLCRWQRGARRRRLLGANVLPGAWAPYRLRKGAIQPAQHPRVCARRVLAMGWVVRFQCRELSQRQRSSPHGDASNPSLDSHLNTQLDALGVADEEAAQRPRHHLRCDLCLPRHACARFIHGACCDCKHATLGAWISGGPQYQTRHHHAVMDLLGLTHAMCLVQVPLPGSWLSPLRQAPWIALAPSLLACWRALCASLRRRPSTALAMTTPSMPLVCM